MKKIIWRDNRRFYYYNTYTDGNEAHKRAKYYKKRNKSRYFIIIQNHKGKKYYHLYLTKALKLW